jgi:hypothetical protein
MEPARRLASANPGGPVTTATNPNEAFVLGLQLPGTTGASAPI